MPRRLLLLSTVLRQNDGSIYQFVLLFVLYLHSLLEVGGGATEMQTHGEATALVYDGQKCGEPGALVVKEP